MNILSQISTSSRQLAVLIDPDKSQAKQLSRLVDYAQKGWIQYFFIGGSLLFKNEVEEVVEYLKTNTSIPVILFPGSPSQVVENADALLLLSLISGRNADLLIGRHVESAPILKHSSLEIIPTGYILIDGGKNTSVSYISNTTPIPSDKSDIAAATAMAGEMLGLKMIYLEAGSGALHPVPQKLILRVKQSIDIPLIVGGGIRSKEQLEIAFQSGANLVVVGTAIEHDPELIESFSSVVLNSVPS